MTFFENIKPEQLLWGAGIAAAALLLFAAFKFATRERFPYMSRMFMSRGELEFYRTLVGCVEVKYMLFAKVRLWDIIDVKNVRRRGRYTAKIRAKHVDFLICAGDSKPLLAIELDDRSHQREDRIERDAFVDKAFAAAGVGILHIKQEKSYDRIELRKKIADAL